VSGSYSATKAQQKSYMVRWRAKQQCMKVAMDSFLATFIKEKLVLKWSPQQISGHLNVHMNISVSTKAVYKFVRSRGLTHYLFWSWNKRKTGRKRYTYDNPKDVRRYIDQRPSLEGYGHYEMDFIVSKHNSAVLLVVVEMKSKYTTVLKLPNRKRITIRDALSGLFHGVELKSITTDNDIAFVHWKELEALLDAPIYVTHPYHSWEKGLVENTNRWIRCFVPKRRDIGTVTEEELCEIHSFLNDRPRAVIGFQFPRALLLAECPN